MGQIAAQLQIVIQPWDNVPVQFFIGTQGSLTQVSKIMTLDGTPVLGGIQIPLNLPSAAREVPTSWRSCATRAALLSVERSGETTDR